MIPSPERPLRTGTRLAAATAVLVACACTPDPQEPEVDLAITDVTVVDAVQGAVPDRTVLVDDGRIVAVRAAGEPVEALQVVDGSGRYVIPGLWDAHVHLTYDDRFTDAMPALFLRHGVTSIRDTGGLLERIAPVVARLRAEGASAPRVFFAGPLLDGETVVYDGVDRPGLGIANPDPETARANVARLADAGVDFVKIYEMVTPEVFAALVEAAEARGLPRDGHVPLSMLARDVGPRMQSLEHLRNLELDCAVDAPELLAERRRVLADGRATGVAGGDLRARLHREQRLPAVERFDPVRCGEVLAALAGTIQVPTLRLNALGIRPPFDRPDFERALALLPEAVSAEWGEAARNAREAAPARDTAYGAFSLRLVGEMHRAGVPLAAGTDTPIGFAIPGYSLHSELEMLVRAGLPPREALRAATLRPAEFFGLDGEMGTVEEGRLADLVLLRGNPLDDITHTRAIEAVVSKGRLVALTQAEERLP